MTSWKEAQQYCASQKQRLMAVREPTGHLIFIHQGKQNIRHGQGVNLGDVTFIGISKTAPVSTRGILLFDIFYDYYTLVY